MTAPIGGTGAQTATVSSPKNSTISKDEFLSLLVTQLKNQDPLNPLNSDQFAAQLAQFTTVEQLTKLNDAMESQTQQQALGNFMSTTNLGASLIGKHVIAEGNGVTVTGGSTDPLKINVGGNGGQGTLKILDAAGREVASKELGVLLPGEQTVTPPSGLPDGNYTYEVDVTGADGKAATVTTYTTGVVDAVLFVNGTVTLRMGKTEVPIDKLYEIAP